MKATIQINVVCTITEPVVLMEQAKAEVDAIKPLDDRSYYYASTPEEALMQRMRTALASGMFECDGVVLHEISHRVLELDPSDK